jgi:hypothetical protein
MSLSTADGMNEMKTQVIAHPALKPNRIRSWEEEVAEVARLTSLNLIRTSPCATARKPSRAPTTISKSSPNLARFALDVDENILYNCLFAGILMASTYQKHSRQA